MNLQDIEITKLIPQRPPFIMVDCVLSCDDTDAVTKHTIKPDNIFLEGETLSAAGIIENMAQSCAARMGCINMKNDVSIKIGAIGDISKCNIYRYPHSGEVLITTVHIILEVFPLTLAQASIRIGDEIIAESRVKIALTDIEATE